ncbi:hypothetical protein TNCV_267951 [Trichonephila clavipes]|nr:hypothetical protein TNCV_267951 [Trichonephila clavipes]
MLDRDQVRRKVPEWVSLQNGYSLVKPELEPTTIQRQPRVSEGILMSHCSATRGLLATDHVILNHGQVTWTTPELAPPLLTTTPRQREDV